MPSLKILSWNIQKFGADKLKDKHVVSFICKVILGNQADVVGLMELVGWEGNNTRDELVAALNNYEALNKTDVKWAGAVSEMTPSRPNEQYLFLWKTDRFAVERFTLWNVLGEGLFDSFFNKEKFDKPLQDEFWASLFTNGWINAAFQLKQSAREKLTADYRNLNLSVEKPQVKLTDDQKKVLVDLMLSEAPVGFPQRGSRPPFILQGYAGNNKTEVFLVLFHAPSPTSTNQEVTANSMLSSVDPVRDGKIVVVMGDFNVSAAKAKFQYSLFYFDDSKSRLTEVRDNNDTVISAFPFQRLIGPKFTTQARNTNLTTALDYGPRLANAKTSIAVTLAAANTVANTALVEGILSSEYDRFFVRAPKNDATDAIAFNPMEAMTPKEVPIQGFFGAMIQDKRRDTAPDWIQGLAEAGVAAYNNWWDRQSNKRRLSAETKQKLLNQPKFGSNTLPGWLREAQYVYRDAISDHLPIIMDLTYA